MSFPSNPFNTATIPFDLEPVQRLTKDLKTAARTLHDDEARFLVDYYYIAQEDRKRSGNQVLALGDNSEPNSVLKWLFDQSASLEDQIKKALDSYTQSHPMGAWMRSIYGIGPVISAGLLANIDIEQAPTVGHIWRFAGLDPTVIWKKTEDVEKDVAAVKEMDEVAIIRLAKEYGRNPENLIKRSRNDKGELDRKELKRALAMRPWNASLKTLLWKAGQSFMKFSGRDECVYGKVYLKRKAYEIERNEAGGNAVAAAAGAKRVGKSTDAYGHYSNGKLPPAQIDARARRYAVKLFVAHLHDAWYRIHFEKEPPLPYPIAILGHAHLITHEDLNRKAA
jgi:hypothetical protein